MAFEKDSDLWVPFRIVDADGDGVTGQNAAALSGMKFKQLTQSGTTSTAFTEVDTAAADYEVNDLGEGDYEVMIPGAGGATANNDLAAIVWVNGVASGGKFVPWPVEVIDPADADLLSLFVSILDQSTGQLDSGSFASGAITGDALAADAGTEIAAAVQAKQLAAAGQATGGTANTIGLQVGDGAKCAAGMAVVITGGTGAGQRPNTIQSLSTDTATMVSNWETNPDSTSRYYVLGAE